MEDLGNNRGYHQYKKEAKRSFHEADKHPM